NNFSGAAEQASHHAGSSGDSSLFSSALSMLTGSNKPKNDHFDEQDAIRQHQNFYGNGGGNNQSANSGNLGSAAAMQALKMFNNQGGNNNNKSGGGDMQSQFIGMAMGQAAKLFDQQHSQGNVQSGANKQDAVAAAAQMALKMYMKSEMGGNNSGNSGSGGSGAAGLINMASKLLR
ncbi:hypothetical protein K470DRAFT_203417, partial [Piedraia hortae CBS 480.64]